MDRSSRESLKGNTTLASTRKLGLATEWAALDEATQAQIINCKAPAPDSAEGAHFEALITLIEAFEAKRFPTAPPSPVDAIKFRMEPARLTVNDRVPSIGQRNRVHDVLNGKRALTLPMIRNLHRNLGIPLDRLVGT